MAILVPRWLDSSWQVRLQMCLKVCMVIFANRTRARDEAIRALLFCEGLRIASSGRGERNLSPSQQLAEEHRSYRTARLGSGTICENHHTKF